jgi:hypothetical protein
MRLRLCWADKIPLVAFAAITLVLLFLGSTGETPPAYADVTAARHWAALLSIDWLIFWKVILGPWIVLRIVDFLMGGPARRIGRRSQVY